MPIQQLQPEFIRPIYSGTWAGKPPAAGNAGKEIIVTDFNRSRWYSDGTYWRPVGGRAVARNWVGANVTFSSGTIAVIAAVPGLLIPADLVATPGFSMRNRVMFHRVAGPAADNQQGYLQLGAGNNLRHFFNFKFTGTTSNKKFVADDTRTINTGLSTFSQVPSTTGAGLPIDQEIYDPVNLSVISDATIVLSGVGVDSAGSDVWYMDQWLTEFIA